MANVNFLDKAIAHVKQAADEDTNENYREAFRLYSLSLEYFLAALKYERNEKRKATIRAKTVEYMERAEQIKRILDEQEENRTEGTAGGAASRKKGEGDDEDSKKSLTTIATYNGKCQFLGQSNRSCQTSC
eukprot:TRINITY_DN3905_c0_g1_i3.p1 TRINITY_DN3905_c0_g1~~TRINITY_DN3905_c0_g1_i3.p1  ORF type:complete len:131 (-),score=30.34 TRINITY_DN3905_c0_g1_i3:81-473(-)